MIAFDETARTLHLGIEDLLDAGPHRAADDEGDPARERLVADALERYLQTEAPPHYQRARRVALEFGWQEYRVHVDGVIDGLFDDGRGCVVEVMRPVPASGGAERCVERAGLLCLLLERGGERVRRARVVELPLGDAPRATLEIAWSQAAFARVLEERLARVERVCLGGRRRARSGQVLGERLRFPFEELRAGQELMLRDVDGAVEHGQLLLCSAPTGIGKTAAVLYPMLRRALLEDRKVFFVTSKVSQQALALETLRAMLPARCGALAVQITARDRICPVQQLGCLPGRCPFMREFPQRLAESGLIEQLFDASVADGELIAALALERELCPLEVSLDLALEASVIVGDFNYVFDPNVYLRRFFDASYAQHLLVVDEAHNLPERAREYFSPRLELPALSALAERCETRGASAYREVARLLRDVVAHCSGFAAALAEVRGDAPPWVEAPEHAFWERTSERATRAALEYAAQLVIDGVPPWSAAVPAPARDPLRQALGSIRDFCRFSAGDPERTAALWTPDSAKLLCLDPSPAIGARMRGFHAAVCMSATLCPGDFHARALGIEGPATLQLDLPSPFPARNRLLLCLPGVDTTWRRRSDDAPRVAELIERCMAVRRGNYLAFFPSFAYRDEVLAQMTRGAARVLVQIPGMPTAPFLRQLERNRDDTLLLCAVHGGVFAEGVDYPAHMAIGVFVVGPGLPLVSLERELIREYYENQLGQGFEHAYVAPGMNRVVQAGGRAIRTPSDRAAIVLLCRRFLEPTYRERLPAWWQSELIDADDPVPLLEAFWSAEDQAQDGSGHAGG